MKKIFFLFISLYFSQCAFTQNTFEKSYYNPNEDISGMGTMVVADSNGYYLSGSYYENRNYKSVLIRTDLYGDTLWTKIFPNGYGNIQLIDKSNPKEYLFMSNPSNIITKSDVTVTKMDFSGNVIWSNTIIKHNWDVPNKIIQTNDNGYLVVGYSNSLPGITIPYPYDAYIIKLSPKGDTLWTKTIGVENNNDYAFEAIETSDSHYLITGYESNSKLMLIKMDTLGNILWTKKYGNQYSNQAHSIAKTNDDNYIIAGTRYSENSMISDFYALKVDVDGNVIWDKTYHFNGYSHGTELLILDSGFLIAGQNQYAIFLLKAGNNGDMVWSKTIATNGSGAIKSIDKCSDGGFIFTSPYSLTLIKTDSNGCVKPNLLSVTGEKNVSINENITFKVNDVRGENYSWKSNYGTVLSGQGTNNVIMYWDKIGVDTVKVLVGNGCGIDSTNIIINIKDCVPLNISKIQNSGYFDFYVEKYEGKSPDYLWNVDKGVILSGQNSNHIVVDWKEYGNLKVSVKVTNDCSIMKDSIEFFYDELNLVEENHISVFPNPAKDGIFEVSNKYNSKVLVQIYNCAGGNIVSDLLDSHATKKYNISVFGKGLFLLKVTGDNLIVSKKIVSQ